eukprot:CAMPEP_0180812340 /NCGR_PEP_ID=MMETSP1038_2-20121128/65943_1 /TAXON_ID=632150 /ORGANISM="Azadinium spinosum, Strain 3D9" /LENGTH=201 /DNA_ID=CAMNT_0022853845 /DNA_START=33 /DNA_END=634 /DNA_ORIENTATION=+
MPRRRKSCLSVLPMWLILGAGALHNTTYLDQWTSVCYQQLLVDSSVRTDSTYVKTIANKTRLRPGAEWCEHHQNKITGQFDTTCIWPHGGGAFPLGSEHEPYDHIWRPWLNYGMPSITLPGKNYVRGADLIQWPPGANMCETPRIMYIHGGSWTGGSPTMWDYNTHTSKISNITGAIVMSIDYPLACCRWDATTGALVQAG